MKGQKMQFHEFLNDLDQDWRKLVNTTYYYYCHFKSNSTYIRLSIFL